MTEQEQSRTIKMTAARRELLEAIRRGEVWYTPPRRPRHARTGAESHLLTSGRVVSARAETLWALGFAYRPDNDGPWVLTDAGRAALEVDRG